MRSEIPEGRALLDTGYSYGGKVAALYSTRPIYLLTNQIQRIEFAKIRFYKPCHKWNLYWNHANGKWELYEPFPLSSNFDAMLRVTSVDTHGCLFG